jgi:FlaA1/EpsC-like NDP-sugar epimerase
LRGVIKMDGKKIALALVKLSVMGGVIGGIIYLAQKALKKEADYKNRFKSYYNVTNQWLLNKNEEKNVGEYFKDNNYKTIAIYGMGNMGELFYEEVKKEDVKIAYFIDKNAEELYYGIDDIPVVTMDDIESQEEVDAIIVTPVYDFDSISESLEELGLDIEIVSLEDVIYGI